MKKAIAILAAFCGILCLHANTSAKAAEKWRTDKTVTVTKNGCDFLTYLSGDGKESWIYQIKINKNGLKRLTFPTKIKGAPVTRIGIGDELYEEDADWYYSIFYSTLEPWHNCYDTDAKAKDIAAIKFPKTVTRIEAGAFCGFLALKKVEIPDGVEELTPYSFAFCKKLVEVRLPAGLRELDVKAFDKSRRISKFTISSKGKNFRTKNGVLLSKKSRKMIWAAPAKKKIVIPKGVTALADHALFATKAKRVVIPKSVRSIGSNALSGKDIEKIQLKKGNKVYKMDGGSIYHKSDKRLVAILVKNGRAKISSKVKILGEGISVMGARHIDRVDIPKSVRKVIEDWMFFLDYEVSGTKIYFYGKKPPKIVSRVSGNVFTAIPIFSYVYVPKGAKKTYIRWADERDGLEWSHLFTF